MRFDLIAIRRKRSKPAATTVNGVGVPASARLGKKKKQRGQAIIWMLGTMAAAAATLYGVYNLSQLNAGKEKAINAADAAALAGATVEARALNLIAYNNRSIIANEVFLVQLASMQSWLWYVHTTSENIGTILEYIPYLNIIGEILVEIGEIAGDASDYTGDIIDGFIPVLEGFKTLFSGAHAALRFFGGALAEDAAGEIISANKTTFGSPVRTDIGMEKDSRAAVMALTVAANQARWIGFSKQYSDDERGDTKDILLRSRDDFSTTRNGNWLTNIDLFVLGLEKHGGTELKGFDRWEAQDTLEFWEKHPCKTGVCTDYTPIGWGRANVDENGDSGDVWAPNRTAQKMAYKDGKNHDDWTGVPSLYDIQDKSESARATLGVDFVIAVRRTQPATLTTSNIGIKPLESQPQIGSSNMDEQMASNQLSAIAKARVSFERPKRNGADWTGTSLFRNDDAKEYGSLFSPYWQARISDFTVTEKGLLMASMGLNPGLAPLTPGGQR